MSQPRENEYVGEVGVARNYQQSKDSVFNKLQQKLNELKLQLGMLRLMQDIFN